ncbi:MAG: manganese efflux pump [Treponema sp.]|nr:manganese efflux pump [Treponema sp.]
MSFIDLLIVAIGLSMDAFAVSICKGLAAKKASIFQMLCAGFWFGGFQALMPFLGWLLASRFRIYIEDFDHWVAFILLAAIGINMIREAFSGQKEDTFSSSFGIKTMFIMAVATSIDALAVGITFGLLLNSLTKIIAASLFICLVTFCFSAAGIKIGSVFGRSYEKKAEIAGGIILILLGIKILLEHLHHAIVL